MDDAHRYHAPLALTVISGIFLSIGGILALAVLADILVRRGWRSMMSIMIVVYPINALYNFPTVLLYWKYGRPTPPRNDDAVSGDKAACIAHLDSTNESGTDVARHHYHDGKSSNDDQALARHEAEAIPEESEPHFNPVPDPQLDSESRGDGFIHNQQRQQRQHQHQHKTTHCHYSSSPANPSALGPANESAVQSNANRTLTPASDGELRTTGCGHGHMEPMDSEAVPKANSDGPHCHSHSAKRPMWATVLVGVAHCGAGCVLGDLVGEWLVYGTGATINGAMLWPALLVDYAFALLFGIAFQYFSIAPMSGEWGLKSVWRAAKADILSLTSFEVGAFAWMIIFQVGIFNYKLEMKTWTYWWLMQMGMNLGFLTAAPTNYILLKQGIKEPCC